MSEIIWCFLCQKQGKKLESENTELKALIRELLDNASFFYSAIELDTYTRSAVDGEEWEKKARAALGDQEPRP